jgi:Uma2 family endonuclease
VNFVDHLVRTYMEEIDDQGGLHRETVAVRLSARETFLPDLCYFTAAQARRLSPTHASFAPTLVVEALSPSTAKRDRGLKFSAYELHGVQECWLLDPDNLEHKFYRRGGDMLDEVDGGVDKITCTSIPGFWVKRSWLDPDKLPKIKQCVKEVLRATSHR